MANRGKEILLLCLAVATLATAIYTFRSNPGARYKLDSPRLQAQTEASRKRAARQPSQRAEQAPARPPVMPKANVTAINRNPFSRPAGAPSAAPEEPKPAVAPNPAAAAAQPQPAPAPVAPAPAPQTQAALPPLSPQTMPAGLTVPTPAPTTPILIGIVGDRAGGQTAVIRLGDRRYFAKAGDKVAGRYLVESVASGQVVLTGAGGKLILKMGGSE